MLAWETLTFAGGWSKRRRGLFSALVMWSWMFVVRAYSDYGLQKVHWLPPFGHSLRWVDHDCGLWSVLLFFLLFSWSVPMGSIPWASGLQHVSLFTKCNSRMILNMTNRRVITRVRCTPKSGKPPIWNLINQLTRSAELGRIHGHDCPGFPFRTTVWFTSRKCTLFSYKGT